MELKCPPDICIFDEGENVVVLNPRFPSWAVINREGLSLLKLCTGELTVEEMAQILSMDTEDVREFVQTLQEYKILGAGEPAPVVPHGLHGVWLNVTNACNLTCLTCYQSSGALSHHELTLREITELMQQIRAFAPTNEPQTIILTGGEPLMRPDIWDICQKGRELGLRINLITNGTLITEEVTQQVASHVDQVQVSLDGMERGNDIIRGKGSFKHAVRGIEALLNAGIVPSVGIVATRINCTEIAALLHFLTEYDITKVRIRPVIPQGRGSANRLQLVMTNTQYQELIQSIYEEGFSSNPYFLKTERFTDIVEAPVNNAKGCPAGWRMVSISSTGDVYPCIAGHIPALKLGSLRKHSFENVWMSKSSIKWRSFDVNTSSHCRTCEWRNFCGGGCKVSAFLHCGDISGGDPYCKAFKNLYYYTFMRGISRDVQNRDQCK